ncbi:MAG: hypothetical protein VXY66_07910, partial [Pseudomonadota bacterium]|nr:hypothetical protein [Pseudomonadota bacterium]
MMSIRTGITWHTEDRLANQLSAFVFNEEKKFRYARAQNRPTNQSTLVRFGSTMKDHKTVLEKAEMFY